MLYLRKTPNFSAMKIVASLAALLFLSWFSQNQPPATEGAWMHQAGDKTTVILFKDGYLTAATFTPKSFLETHGGPFAIHNNEIVITLEFNSLKSKLAKESIPFKIQGNKLVIDNLPFEKIDNGEAPLAGVWEITGRMQDEKMVPLHRSGTRKTLKILTGKRFQWFAIDPAINSFTGTGGGTYTFEKGKYTENIEFFSRDSTRAGSSLSFDDHLENEKWHHTGLSSKGDKIDEIWEKIKP